jgi:hypothetical protein
MSKLFLDPKMMAVFMSSVPKSKAENFVSAVYSRLSPENQAILSNIVQVQAPVRTLTEDRE